MHTSRVNLRVTLQAKAKGKKGEERCNPIMREGMSSKGGNCERCIYIDDPSPMKERQLIMKDFVIFSLVCLYFSHLGKENKRQDL